MDQVTNGPFVPEMISLWQEAQKELDGSGCISEDAALMFSYNTLYGRRWLCEGQLFKIGLDQFYLQVASLWRISDESKWVSAFHFTEESKGIYLACSL